MMRRLVVKKSLKKAKHYINNIGDVPTLQVYFLYSSLKSKTIVQQTFDSFKALPQADRDQQCPKLC